MQGVPQCIKINDTEIRQALSDCVGLVVHTAAQH